MMARQPIDSEPDDDSSPRPRNLYATSDIRFVTLEIGKLTSKVDRLIEDVGKQTAKVSDLEKAVDRVKTVGWLLGGIIAVVVFLFGESIKQGAQSVVGLSKSEAPQHVAPGPSAPPPGPPTVLPKR
jgi:hypothetical protein